jgi:hypothetical protein
MTIEARAQLTNGVPDAAHAVTKYTTSGLL